jgi:hypothetical protein
VKIDSQSLLPMLSGVSNVTRFAYAEKFGTNTGSPDGRALRDDRYKIIRFDSGGDEFYDLQSDPIERTNLLLSTLTVTQQQEYDHLVFHLGAFSTNAGPRILEEHRSGGRFAVSVLQVPGATYALWRCADPSSGFWSPVAGANSGVTNGIVVLTDPAPLVDRAFYSVVQSP